MPGVGESRKWVCARRVFSSPFPPRARQQVWQRNLQPQMDICSKQGIYLKPQHHAMPTARDFWTIMETLTLTLTMPIKSSGRLNLGNTENYFTRREIRLGGCLDHKFGATAVNADFRRAVLYHTSCRI